MVLITRTTTPAEFERFISLPENQARHFELIGGEIVEMPSNIISSAIASRILGFIFMYLLQNNIGNVTDGQGGYQIGSERYAPDVAFISHERGMSTEWFHPNPPELAVEVDYPSTVASRTNLMIKVSHYLSVGTTVWVVFYEEQEVLVYVPNQPVQVLGLRDTLDGGAILPNFTLPVKDIFPVSPPEIVETE